MTTLLRDVRSATWSDDLPAAPTAVLLLHGYGSNEHDLAGLAAALELTVPWASLRAPLESGARGAAWFAITTPGNPDPEPVAAATDAIWAWVDENLDPGVSVTPIGFSQGGLMATQLLRTRPERVVAPVVLGGFVQAAAQPGDATLAAARPALFWGRGADDRVIAESAIARTVAWLPEHTALTARTYPGLAHSINAAEVADVTEFLATHVPSALGDGRLSPASSIERD
jgi:phospholipase/carboxylesterase